MCIYFMACGSFKQLVVNQLECSIVIKSSDKGRTFLDFDHFTRRNDLTNKEASTVFCSVVKRAGSGRTRKKCRGKHETQSSVFPTS